MERIGERLRRRREELGFTIEDVARATRYRPEVIRAVEEGRGGAFPAEAYLKAFLRAYALKLGLDPAEIVREQKSEVERVQEAIKEIRIKPRKNSSLRRTLVWLVVIVASAAAILVLYDRFIRKRRVTAPERRAEEAGPAVLTSPAKGDTTDTGGSAPVGQENADADEGAEGQEENHVKDEGRPGVEPTRDEPIADADRAGEPAEGRAGSGPDDLSGEGDMETAPAGRPVSRLVVSVTGYAVRARLRAGDSVLVHKWLRPGYRETFYSAEPFWADTIITHEDAISLRLDGEPVRLPEARDKVITNFRISPQAGTE